MAVFVKALRAKVQLRFFIVADAAESFVHDPPEQVVHAVHDLLPRAIVGGEIDLPVRRPLRFVKGPVFLKEDLRVCAAETVNALLDVADHEEVRPAVFLAGERIKKGVLHVVDVLVLIDDDLVEFRRQFLCQRRPLHLTVPVSFDKKVKRIMLDVDEVGDVAVLHLCPEGFAEFPGEPDQCLLRPLRHPDQFKLAGGSAAVPCLQLSDIVLDAPADILDPLVQFLVFGGRLSLAQLRFLDIVKLLPEPQHHSGKILSKDAVDQVQIALTHPGILVFHRRFARRRFPLQAEDAVPHSLEFLPQLLPAACDPFLAPEGIFLLRLRFFRFRQPLIRINGVLRGVVQFLHHVADVPVALFRRVIRKQRQKVLFVRRSVFFLQKAVQHVVLQQDKFGLVRDPDVRRDVQTVKVIPHEEAAQAVHRADMRLRSDRRLLAEIRGIRIRFQGFLQFADQFGPHLGCRRVRIGHDDHAAEVAFFFLQAVQHVRDQGRRLAAARRCRHQQGASPVADDLFLHGTGNEAHRAASFPFAASTTS